MVALLCASALALAAPAAAAAPEQAVVPDAGKAVMVIEVSGLLDPILVDFVQRSIADAEREQRAAVVLRLNSPGAVVSDARIVELAQRMRASSVPVSAWVGPSGAKAAGAAAQLAAAALPGGIAHGAKIGQAGDQILPVDTFGVLFGPEANRVRDRFIGVDDALAVGLVPAATIGDFIINLEQVVTRQIQQGDEIRLQPQNDVLFAKPPLGPRLVHNVASPPVAYLLFVVGLGLILFELYTAGVGVAGVVGAVSLLLGCYGLAALPLRWWAVALLVGAFVAFAVDVQTGVPRFWTGVGLTLFAVGTFTLFDGVSMSWVTIAVAFAGVLVTFLSGMPSMVRARFSTPTIGRDWMIGEIGMALTAVDPEGTISVRSAPWRARTNRATPLQAGDRLRVVGIEGLIVEVEPESGGARDYRERARDRS
ncbi:MAG: NfeD family protein [Acidimicrobiales bacterium]